MVTLINTRWIIFDDERFFEVASSHLSRFCSIATKALFWMWVDSQWQIRLCLSRWAAIQGDSLTLALLSAAIASFLLSCGRRDRLECRVLDASRTKTLTKEMKNKRKSSENVLCDFVKIRKKSNEFRNFVQKLGTLMKFFNNNNIDNFNLIKLTKKIH